MLRTNNDYESTGWGVYAQDMIQVAPHWKVLAGLRYDNLVGNYNCYAIPNNAQQRPDSITAPTPATK